MKRKFLVVTAVLLYSTLQAQQTVSHSNLEEVVVTASRKEQKQSQTGKVITVIDQQTLQNNVGKSLTEILNQYAGLFTVGANNTLGVNQELYLRGAATGNTLILLDGVPLQDPSHMTNNYDWNNINPNHIERIEILKGAQSTLWGSNAVAGVINIITKKGGRKKVTPHILVNYGSYKTLKLGGGISGAVNRLSYNLSYNRITSDGFSAAYDSLHHRNFDKDGFLQNALQANVGYKISSALSANYATHYSQYNTDADAMAFVDDFDAINKSKNWVNTVGLHYKKSKLALHLTQSWIQADRRYTDDSTDIGTLRLNPTADYYTKWSEANYKGHSLVTELYGNYDFSRNLSVVSGVQYMKQKTDQQYQSISNYGPYITPSIGDDSVNIRNFALYASALLTDWKGFNVELGSRLNHHSTYGNTTTFSFNPSYNLGDQTKLFLNISSGYNTPSLYQLYSEFGNKNLKPEKSVNYELGISSRAQDGNNAVRIVAFKRDIKDLIVFYTNPETFASVYINRDEQKDYGFELESVFQLNKASKWVTNFTYLTGEGISNGVKANNLFRRPEFTFNSTLTINPTTKLTLIPSFRYVGQRLPSTYDIGPNPMPAYYHLDFYASCNIARQCKLFADFRNITNQMYFDLYGYNSRSANYMLGLNLSL